MKFSEQWLREWVNPSVDTKTLADQLTMAGLEVDTVEPAALEFSGVVIGQVLSAESHPDAKRLRCCKVDVGGKEILDIVCGGVNVREGLLVPVAIVGSVLPGDFKIKKANLRGQPSQGMICSSQELGLGEGIEGGIMELRDDAPVGEDFREYLQLDDQIIDVELTPNRGDCLSIRGIARDVAVVNQMKMQAQEIAPPLASIEDRFPVSVFAEEACPRYTGRVIKNINSQAQIPLWMEEHLRRSGIRAIHPVVDILNYVMLEIGQPMHAFDLEKLNDEIQVRSAKKGEKITLLDAQEVDLKEGTLVIADAKNVLAIAGVMGGLDSAVNENTQHVFLESAYFESIGIRQSAKFYGLQTDSSHRFERGVDYLLQMEAVERATALLLEIVGGEAGPVVEVAFEDKLPTPVTINFRSREIARLLGVDLEDSQIETILMSLDMELRSANGGWLVEVPSYRYDLHQEADLVEEVARIYGYDQIPTHQMLLDATIPALPESHQSRDRIRNVLVDQGYHEAITYSFIDTQLQQLFDPEKEAIALVNPIASDMAVMRTSLWPGLVQAMLHNLNRQAPRVRLFEIGLCFEKTRDHFLQPPKLGLVATGGAYPEQWGEEDRPVDFYDVKGDISMMLSMTGRARDFRWESVSHPALHPGQSAAILLDDCQVGYLGVLHPRIAVQLDIQQTVCLFEIDLMAVQHGQIPEFQPISKYPTVRRDLAIIIEQSISAGAIQEAIQKKAGQLLNTVQIFDIYQGQGIEKGKKSVALGLTFQDPSRTLIDTEINDVIQSVVATLERDFNAKLRA